MTAKDRRGATGRPRAGRGRGEKPSNVHIHPLAQPAPGLCWFDPRSKQNEGGKAYVMGKSEGCVEMAMNEVVGRDDRFLVHP